MLVLYTGRKFDKPAHGGVKIEVTRTRGSVFAPSQALLDGYKAGEMSWEEFERRYGQEIRAKYAEAPQPFLEVIERAAREDVTLTCWEKGDEATVRCHRRLLKDFLVRIARERGLEIDHPRSPRRR